ncbi:pilus assembly protein PilM [Alicyclobacillus mali]|uniref:Pilus assembly protein PilM n=1 Tax=Alicyclobacillus mali (ex Roth et al. 2021) TaxID=1123961 RepID=A0ABS0F1D9_9BACL|nr:pilus assembly protein PilM [Alicyclobacillus mali (ex Roth et al. 2021)]MBF8377093.1 pilus assembly protein PilM [Alicyclobacillus mali (ex Roth et al. 2021)]
MPLRLTTSSRSTSVGVEICDAGLRIAEVEPGRPLRVSRLETAPWDLSETVRDPYPTFAIAPILSHAFDVNQRKKLTVHVALPSRFTVIRQLTLPAVGEKELQSAIELQIQHNIHLPFDEAEYDYVLCDPSEDEADSVSVLLVAADKSRVNDVIQGFRSVGIRPKTIDIHALALYRLIRRFRPDMPQNFLLLETSEDTVDMHVFHDGLLYLTRQVPVALAPTSDVPAFDYVSQFDVEIERTLNFFMYTLNQREAGFEQVFVTLPRDVDASEHLQALEERIGMPCEVLPLAEMIRRNCEIGPEAHRMSDLADYAAAIGLALRGV